MANKGALAVGYDADIAIVDPRLRASIPTSQVEVADYSPFEGMTLKGWPVATFSRGRRIMADGTIPPSVREHPAGHYLFRS
jgi:dihydropyrimidinase